MAWTKHLEKMLILRANILSGPLASIPSRPVSSTVVRKERVNFLFVWIHFHASGKSVSPTMHFSSGWSLMHARLSVQGPWICASLCLVLYLDHTLVPLRYLMLQVSCPQSGLPWPPWPPRVSHQNCPCPTELFFLLLLKLLQRSVWGVSPVIQWWRTCLAVQGMQVWFLIRELRSHISWSNQACAPQLENPWATKKTQHSQNK